MTTLPTTTRQLQLDHEALVERTLALLPQRREVEGARTPAATRARRPRAVDAFIPPSDHATYEALLERIDQVREGTLVSANARAQIMEEADTLGIRPFDASMMIALAQDRARRGESNRNIPSLLQARPADPGEATIAAHRPDAMSWIAVATSGLLIAGLVAMWFSG